MNDEILYLIEDVGEVELLEFLKEVSEDETTLFPLEERINLQEYCNKILNHAINFTARTENELIGIVSIYINNEKTKTAYITLVHVKPLFRGKRIASKLLENSIAYVYDKGFVCIDLEVFIENESAILLYAKKGFDVIEKKEISYIMRRNI